MKKKFQKLLSVRWAVVMLACAAALSGCGSDPLPSGAVVQGPVAGAIIFADHATGEGANRLKDSDEIATTSNADGSFSLPTFPNYDYVIVSQGGTDTLSGKPALEMLAPFGARNVSPLTTLVTLDTTGKMKGVLESLGVKYDDDISKGVTPAALFVVKSVESMITSLTQTLKPGNGDLTKAQNNFIQEEVFKQFASTMQNKTAADLTDAATLTTTLQTAMASALSTIDGKYDNITIADKNAVATAIAAPCVNAVANAIGDVTKTGAADVKAEAAIIVAAEMTELVNIIDEYAAEAANQVVVTVPANTLPTISGTPATAVFAGAAYNFAPKASDVDGDTLTFSIANKPAWATFNTATGALTGAATVGTTTGIVISVTDGKGSSVSLPAFTLTVTQVTGATGSTGSGGGSGF